jgi:signal transduction histidine kinase
MNAETGGRGIRASLAAMTAAVTLLVVAGFVIPLGFMLATQARDQAVDAGELQGRSIAAVIQTGASKQVLSELVSQANSGRSRRRVDTVLPDQSIIGPPLPGVTWLARGSGDRATVMPAPDGAMMVIVPAKDNGSALVRVLVPAALITKGVARDWTLLSATGVILVALAVAVADRLGRSIVRPIRQLESVATRLTEGDLAVRAKSKGPREVRSVASAINRLSQRISELLAAEREAAADLSHRLRTPLTALRLHAESLSDRDERHVLTGDVQALTAMVDAVIKEARSASSDQGPSRVAEVVANRIRFWKVLADKQGRSLRVSLPDGDALVGLAPGDLQAAIDAIVANVFAHTPEETPFSVAVTLTADRGSICVEDRGPGIRTELMARGTSGGGGTGLGLDIARRTMELANGTVSIARRPGGGSAVTMRFPTLTSAATAETPAAPGNGHIRV